MTTAFYKGVSVSKAVEAVAILLKKRGYYIKNKIEGPIGLVYAYRNECNPSIDYNNCVTGKFSKYIAPTTTTVNTMIYGNPDIEMVPNYGSADAQGYSVRVNAISRSDMIASVVITAMPENEVRIRVVFQYVAYYSRGIQAASCNIVTEDCKPGAYPSIYEDFFKDTDQLLDQKRTDSQS
ncbi:hypothetical protein [Entomobacter blattae]|uniref:hypothetical protein n=1 Tax=Entomobacter blattae TaxID=2762277 RepID=UPI00193BF883|nr:hypothetical protein [Entomobacter blattae]